MTPDFRVLGELRASVAGRRVDLGAARQRCVLVALLMDLNSVVSVDNLIDRVWADRPPQRARETLHTYLSRLRGVLEFDDTVRLERRSGGYVLIAEPLSVDLHRFRGLVADSRSASDGVGLLGQALAMWTGEPFTGLETVWLCDVRASLEVERHEVELEYHDHLFRAGRYGEVVPRLRTLVGENPLDERLVGQFMLALSRSGRRAEALDRFHLLRATLRDEVGVDPGSEVTQLFQEIVTDSTLSLPAPAQLPLGTAEFVGRQGAMERLSKVLLSDGGTSVCVVEGIGGIGKTALARHWTRQHVTDFPDGLLYADLRGFDPSGDPADPRSILQDFLGAVGIDPRAVPATVPARAALLRSVLAARRMLMVLDNVRDSEQVLPLLPGSQSCAVLITSRSRLATITANYGAAVVSLDTMDDGDARSWMISHVGIQRMLTDESAVADILRYCGGIPLALTVIIGRATSPPEPSLAAIAAELADVSGRLHVFDEVEPTASLSAILSWSYDALSPEQVNLIELLAIAPGPEISLAAAANLCDLPENRCRHALRAIEATHLISQHIVDRYYMHDLVRLYTIERATHDIPEESRSDALRRIVAFYARTARAADALLWNSPENDVDSRRSRSLFPDQASALRWLDVQRHCLPAAQQLALDRGWSRDVIQLATGQRTYNWWRGHPEANLVSWQRALSASDDDDIPLSLKAYVHQRLGAAYGFVGDSREAFKQFQLALDTGQRAGDMRILAQTHRLLAWAWIENDGEYERAIHEGHRALEFYAELDEPTAKARALETVGFCAAKLGRLAEAREFCSQALDLCRTADSLNAKATVLGSLGFIERSSGDLPASLVYAEQSLSLFIDNGNLWQAAEQLVELGHTYAALSRRADAISTWRRAYQQLHSQHRLTHAAAVLTLLAAADKGVD